MENYGEYFKAIRGTKGLTLRDVERETGISNAYLSQLESSKIKQPSPIHLFKLASLYEIEYEMLMEKVGYPVPQKENLETRKRTAYSRFGNISKEEEIELLEYLKFIRKRNKK